MLRKGKESCEEEMVLEFLKAEIKSEKPAHRNYILNALVNRGIGEEIINNGNLSDDKENTLRTEILGESRGYKNNQYLFEGFPDDISWHWGSLDCEDSERLRYPNTLEWRELSGYTRSPSETAKYVLSGMIPGEGFFDTLEYLKAGGLLPPLILFAGAKEEQFIILDGCHRATAYALEPFYLQNTKVLVGYCRPESLAKWKWV